MPDIIFNKINSIVFSGYLEKMGSADFTLEEKSRTAKCKIAKFKAKKRYVVFKFDKRIRSRDRLFNFLNDDARNNSMCDFIIFYLKQDRLFAVCCNMKSTTPNNNKDQLNAGIVIAETIFQTAKRLSVTDYRNLIIKCTCFSYRLLYKGTTNNRLLNNISVRPYLSNDETNEVCDLDTFCN